MVLKRQAQPVSDEVVEDLFRAVAENDRQAYGPDFDYYRDIVAKNPPDPWVCIPHKVTGESVGIDLFTATLDDIMERCGFPEDKRDFVLRLYRGYLLDRLPYWPPEQVPDDIPILQPQ